MKQKRAARVERRRNLVEINLASPRSKAPSRSGRPGCLPFGTGLLVLGAEVLIWVGLH